jgi:hypothetical protein
VLISAIRPSFSVLFENPEERRDEELCLCITGTRGV